MNKFFKTLTCALLSGSMLFAVACKPGSGNDTETRPFTMSIGALEGLFNPFFSTSLTDSQVISQTMASLISVSTDSNGNAIPVAGEDYPSVALDFKTTYYDQKTGGNETTDSSKAKRTEYEFLIKNGMKFSDGEPLTIDDVLFTFYVYLDPAYIGSNTMYSVDIQGLKAYQENNSTIADDAQDNSAVYRAAANERFNNLLNYGLGSSAGESVDEEAAKKDYARAQELYRQEVTNDWATVETSWQETYKEYRFTEAWQAYLYQETLVQVQRKTAADQSTEEIKDANGKKYTTLDPWQPGASGGREGITELQHIIDDIDSLTTDAAIQQYISAHNIQTENPEEYARLQITKEYCINKVFDTKLGDISGLPEILTGWATGTNLYNEFIVDARKEITSSSPNPVYSISGITTAKTREFNGKNYDDDHDVLKIAVNDVDPAAIWQFGVTVAPLHYYSTHNYNGHDYIEEFNRVNHFGVERGDSTFFDTVLKDTNKNGLPVGAGPYMASTINGGVATDGADFSHLNIVYYERNPYFETMGAGISNAKIKYMRYRVVDEQRILSSIGNGEVDYGEPTATADNVRTVNGDRSTYGRALYDTNGFGYVGVNPTYVPNIGIRRIIMNAMDPNESVAFYGPELSSVIYRPMSKTSWAYPKDSDGTSSYYSTSHTSADNITISETHGEYSKLYEKDAAYIEQQVRALGYQKGSDGIYAKGTDKLVYTFTIAGAAADDHPAYRMFTSAAALLNSAGFKITVTPDVNALKSLTTGGLAVWAAAWSSGVDPDMYQVYHKDSQATSVLNWGYRTIYDASKGSTYITEQRIVDSMSLKIEEARKTIDQNRREELYKDCLNQLMELAVELPVYQRKDLCVYNLHVVAENSVNQNANATNGVLDRIWEVTYI